MILHSALLARTEMPPSDRPTRNQYIVGTLVSRLSTIAVHIYRIQGSFSMKCLLRSTIVAGALAAFSLSTMAADIAASSHNKNEQRATDAQGISPNTTQQQRIEIRKKTKAHWRDPPTGDRTSRIKTRRERPDQNTERATPTGKVPASVPK